MRVLHLLAPAQVGGLERVVQGLADGFCRRGHSVTVGAVAAGDDPLSPFLEPLIKRGVKVRRIHVPHRAYVRERRRMAEICRQVNPDVLHNAWISARPPRQGSGKEAGDRDRHHCTRLYRKRMEEPLLRGSASSGLQEI